MNMLSRLIWLFILIGAVAAAATSYYNNHKDETEQADRLSRQVTGRLNDQLTVLEGVRALFLTSEAGDDVKIREYLRRLENHRQTAGIQGIGINLATTPATAAATEARIARTYGQPIKIWPQSEGNLSYPIVLIEPFDALNRAVLGFDMYSEPIRRRAMQRAWTSGKASASGILQLVQDDVAGISQPGLLIFLPITDGEQSRPAPQGTSARSTTPVANIPVPAFVFAPVRISELINSVLGPQLPGIKGVEVFAGTQDGAPLLYQRGDIQWGAQKTRIRIADTEWTMVISYDRTFSRVARPIIVALVGILLAALILRINRIQRRRLGAFRVLAEEKARHAEDRELIIGEMAHRLKNAFARVGALARITIRESASLAEFETRFDGRLRALADTKQLMVSGAHTALDLCRLIRRELELAGCPADMRASVNGPAVHLDDEGAQAISLVIHELVTNSIKYGALSGVGQLSVGWVCKDHIVELSWAETHLRATPIFDQESFGTHFIRSLIQRQLKGDWQRIAGDHQLTVLIRWQETDEESGAD